MEILTEKLNEVLKRYGAATVSPNGVDGEEGRLALLWEAFVKLAARLNHIMLDEDAIFTLDPTYGGEQVSTAAGARINGRLCFYLNPDSVVVPVNKSPTLAFLLIKRAAQVLVDVSSMAQYVEKKELCDSYEEAAAWEYTAFWDMAKAYRFKNNPQYKAWFKEGET